MLKMMSLRQSFGVYDYPARIQDVFSRWNYSRALEDSHKQLKKGEISV